MSQHPGMYGSHNSQQRIVNNAPITEHRGTQIMRSTPPTAMGPVLAGDSQLRRLEMDVRNSKIEEERLRSQYMAMEATVQQNQAEIASFRDQLVHREEEMRRLRNEESYRLQVVMEEYRNRFEKERTRLGLALQKTDACTKIISEVLPECIECEKILTGKDVPQFQIQPAERSMIDQSFQNKTQMMLS